MSNQFPRVPLSQLAELQMGATPSRAEPSFWAKDVTGHPWVAISDIREKNLWDTAEEVTYLGARAARLREVPAGIPIVSFKLSLGKAAIPQRAVYVNEAIVALFPRRGRADASWLYYAVPRVVKSAFAETAIKGKTLNLAKLNDLPIPVPESVAEQRRIAGIMEAVDQEISMVQSMIEKRKIIERAAVVQALGESWNALPLGEIATVTAGLTLGPEPSGASSVELPYLRVANVQDGYIDTSNLRTVRVLRADVRRYAVQKGDVLLTEGGDFDKLGRGAVWDGRVEPCLHQNHVFRVRCRSDLIIPDYLALHMASQAGRRYFLRVAKQTTNLASINSTQLKAMPIPVPPLAEQEGILGIVKAARQAVAAEQSLRDKLRLVKKGLMDDLLTGKVRVGNVEGRL